MRDVKRVYIDCDCGTHSISIEEWAEEPGTIYLTFWKTGSDSPTLRQRLSHAWYAFKTGMICEEGVYIKKKQLNTQYTLQTLIN